MVCIARGSYDSTSGGEREIQRTMLELLNQLDGFDARGEVKVCDPARPVQRARLQVSTHAFILSSLILILSLCCCDGDVMVM